MYFDRLVNACTAFRTYSELVLACDNGYVPTLFRRTRRERMLRRVLQAAGLTVYPR